MTTETSLVSTKDGLVGIMDQMKTAIANVLPKHITPDRVVKMAMVAASRDPKLFQCTRNSFYQAIMRSSELGLDCSGTLGSAYIVPFWSGKLNAYEAVLIPGYRGLIELARRSGKIVSIEAHIIHKADEYEVVWGTDPKLVHKPELEGNPGPVIAAYMVAKMKDGATQVEVMTLTQLEAIRHRSKAGERGPWKTDTEEMYRKTVVKRGMKYLPLSPEAMDAVEYDHRVDGIKLLPEPAEEKPVGPTARSEGLAKRIEVKNGGNPKPEPAPVAPEPETPVETEPPDPLEEVVAYLTESDTVTDTEILDRRLLVLAREAEIIGKRARKWHVHMGNLSTEGADYLPALLDTINAMEKEDEEPKGGDLF